MTRAGHPPCRRSRANCSGAISGRSSAGASSPSPASERSESVLHGRRARRHLEEHRLRQRVDEHQRRQDSRHRDSIGALAVAPSNPKSHLRGNGRSATFAATSIPATASTRATDAGKTWQYAGLRDTHTTTSLVDRSARSERRVRCLDGPRVQTAIPNAASSKPPTAARRGTKCSSSTTTPARPIVVMDPHEPARAVRGDVAGAPQAVETYERRPGQRLVQDHRRAARIGRRFPSNPGIRARHARQNGRRGFGEQSARRLRDRAGARRRRLPLGRRRRDVEARQRRDEIAPARLLLYGDLRRSRRTPTSRTRRKSTACSRRPTAAKRGSAHHARRATITSCGSTRTIRRSCSKATTAARRFRSTAARRGAPKTISRRGSITTSRSTTVSVSRLRRRARRRRVRRTRARRTTGLIDCGDWHGVASGESTFVAPEPGNAERHVRQRLLQHAVRASTTATGETAKREPVAEIHVGRVRGRDASIASAGRIRSCSRRRTATNCSSRRKSCSQARDRGKTWTIISPDLTRNDKSTEGPSGGPIDLDQTGAETFPDIFVARRLAARTANVMWAGSADGLVHVTTDHGAKWTARHAAGAAAVGADQQHRTVAYGDRGTAYLTRLALHVGRLPSLRLQNDRLRRALDAR